MAAVLSDRLGTPISIENDATAAAYAVHKIGVGRGTQEMIYLTISTGIGGGNCHARQANPWRGWGGGRVRSHDHRAATGRAVRVRTFRLLGDDGVGTAIARTARMRMEAGEESSLMELARERGYYNLTARDVFAAAEEDDALSRSVVDGAGNALGIGLANIVNIFNPELIVLGGGLARGQDEFVKYGISVARERAFALQSRTVRFEVTELGDDNGLLGALLLARENAARSARQSAERAEGERLMEGMAHKGANLDYVSVTPTGYDPAREYPIIILVHGFGASMYDLAGLAPAFGESGYVFLCPNGPRSPGYRRRRLVSRGRRRAVSTMRRRSNGPRKPLAHFLKRSPSRTNYGPASRC